MIAAAERLSGCAAQLAPMAFTRLFDTWQAATADERQESGAQLVLELMRLQRFLGLHFRSADQRKLIRKA